MFSVPKECNFLRNCWIANWFCFAFPSQRSSGNPKGAMYRWIWPFPFSNIPSSQMLTALPKPKQKTSVNSFSGPCLQGFLTYCLKEKNFLIWLIEEKDVKDSSNKLFLSIMKIHPRSTDWLLSDLAVIPDVRTVHAVQAPCQEIVDVRKQCCLFFLYFFNWCLAGSRNTPECGLKAVFLLFNMMLVRPTQGIVW